MKNKIKRFVCCLALLVITAFSLNGMAYGAQPIELKLAHITAPGGMMDKKAQKFAALVEEKTGGKVKVTVYPAQQLGNIKEILQGVSMGTIDMAQENAQFIEQFEKDYAIFGCPFMFTRDELKKSKYIVELEDKIKTKTGIRTLPGISFRPAMHLFTQKRVVMLPSDLNAIKLRTWQSKPLVDTWNGLGATAVPLPWGDVYLALAQGIVNGMPHNIVQVRDEKFYEQLNYCTLLDFMPIFDRTWISDAKFKSLSPDVQKAIVEASIESSEWFTTYAKSLEVAAKQQLQDAGIKFVETDRQKWVVKAQKVLEQLEKDGLWSKGLMKKLHKDQ